MNLRVTARITARDPDALVPLLRELTEHSRGEPGCLDYGWYRNGDLFTSIELWDSAVSERAHNQTAFLDTILVRIRPLLASSPEVIRWETI